MASCKSRRLGEGETWTIAESQFLVQGGTTSVGMYAIELAKTIGLKVVATCSPRSNDLVKSFGADEVVDYHDVDKAIAQIKSITDGGVAGALECVGGADASRLTISSFGPKGGILTCLLAVEKDIAALRPDVKTERILVYTTGGYVSPLCLPHVRQAHVNRHSLWFPAWSSPRPTRRTELGTSSCANALPNFSRSTVSKPTRSMSERVSITS